MAVMCAPMICAYCVSTFQNASMPPYYRPPGDGEGETLRPGSVGVERALELLRGIGGYIELFGGERITSMDAVTMIDGSAMCGVHAFTALQQRAARPAWAYR